MAILVAWLTAFPASILFAILGAALFPDAAQPEFNVSGPAAIFALVILSPVVETLIMGAVLLLLLLFLSPTLAIIISAIGWGVAHSVIVPIWGLVIWWPFLVFSTLFVTWSRRSVPAALVVASATHALQNFIPGLLLLLQA
jgi:hypothetical protein